MPVMDSISEAVKLGSKSAPLNANQYATLSVASQSAVSSTAFQPTPSGPIPVIPIGAPASFALNKITALPGEITKQTANIISKIQKQYNKQYETARKKRLEAKESLFIELKSKQEEIKTQIPIIEDEITNKQKQLIELEINQKDQMNMYLAKIFGYKLAIISAREIGDTQTEQKNLDNIEALNSWLEAILLLLVDIVNLKVELKYLQLDLEFKEELINIKINKIWDEMVELSPDFEVVVPYYPDLPDQPTLPELPKFPELPPQARTAEKQFAKWVVTPTVPPIGLRISSLLLMITESVPNTTAQASQKEAEADSILLKSGGCS